jgi:uncharacterized membrane protein YGL010W
MATKSLRQYLEDYANGHRQTGTRLTHLVGIPMIVASLPICPFNPLLAGALFTGGWALQVIGHRVFEKNNPLLLDDPLNMLIGAIWAAREWASLLGLDLPLVVADAE